MPPNLKNSAADRLPEDVIHHIFTFLTSPADFRAASLLSKHWYRAEGSYRRAIKVRNCLAVSPRRLTRRFNALTSVTLIGRPDVFDSRPTDVKWRVYADPWIECLAANYGGLRSLKLKRFVLSHRSMMQISRSFPGLRSLVLVGCEAIPGFGLGLIVSDCRFLEVLELRDCSGMSEYEQWFRDFPENCDSLVSLSFVNVKSEVDVLVLERLVSRCRNLTCLKLDEPLPRDVVTRILEAAPQLVELGCGTSEDLIQGDSHNKFMNAIINCTSIQGLSGAWVPGYLGCMSTICSTLLFLDLTKMRQVPPNIPALVAFIPRCHNLQRLWVLNDVGDTVLREASKCIELKELKILPQLFGRKFDADEIASATVTEASLGAIAESCHKLQSVSYTSKCMSNATLLTLAQNNPDIKSFELTLLKYNTRDVRTFTSLDEGFGAILQSCKNLNKLSICNAYVTDQVFFFAGMFGAQLKKLYVTYDGDSNTGIFYALNLCQNLNKLVIAGPFGDSLLLAAADKLKNLQYVWLRTGRITVKGSKTLKETSSRSNLSVHIMDPISKIKDMPLDMEVQNLLIYHSFDEPHEHRP